MYDHRSDFRTAATSDVGTSVYESARQSNVPDLSLRHSPRLRGDTATEGFSTAPIGENQSRDLYRLCITILRKCENRLNQNVIMKCAKANVRKERSEQTVILLS